MTSRLDMGAAPGPRFPIVFGNPHRIGALQQWQLRTPAVRWPARWAVLLVAVLAGACSRSPTDPNVAAWRVLPGQVESFVRPGFRAGRQCWVYLPPGYATSRARYPVLYTTDGEWMFDGNNTVHVNRICEDLIRQGEIRPIIVVAIENVPGLREWELTPWGDGRFFGGGQQFLQAIRDTLKPEIDRRFRTLPNAASTAIAGASLGGVFAAYAGIAYSETFGNVAAFSPSYWLDGRHIVAFTDSVSRIRPLSIDIRRFYQDTGTDGDNYIGDMERRLETYGFRSGYNFLSLTVEDAQHNYGAWAHRYPQMLEFLFPPE